MICRLRPFYVVKPTEKDRKTCMCKIHDNLQMKLNAAYATGMSTSKSIDDVTKAVVCDEGSKECMYMECTQCKDKTVEWNFEGNEGSQLTWKVWRNKRETVFEEKEQSKKVVSRTVKETDQGTKRHLSSELNTEINRARRHIFNIRAQYKSLKHLREKLSHEEIMMHIDLSENYNCKYSNEIQSMHFGPSRRQISWYTGVVYVGAEVIPFCSVSDNLRHGPSAIWAHIQPVISYIKDVHSTGVAFKGIHFISDGPTTQYHNKINFHLWAKKVIQNGFKTSTWNFLEASHGKGAADGVGAAMKRKAGNLVTVKQVDIMCEKDLYNSIKGSDSRVKMFLVKDEDIDSLDNTIPDGISPIPNTMKLHQLCLQANSSFTLRVLSCFCQYPEHCDCFQPTVTIVKMLKRNQTQNGEEHTVYPGSEPEQNEEQETFKHISEVSSPIFLRKPEMLSLGLLGQYVVVKYDGIPYPGLVLDIDEDDVEVKVMHKVGPNRYFWPRMEDRLWYREDDIVCVIDQPKPVTSRHCEIDPKLWPLIQRELNI